TAGNVAAQSLPATHAYSGLGAASALSRLERDGNRPAGPRSEATGLGTNATKPKRITPPFRFRDEDIAISDVHEVIFFTETRPVRVRLRTKLATGTLAAEWKERMRKLFDFFDRDGDGYLNEFEAQFVFSNRGVTQMIALGTATPGYFDSGRTLADFDRDGD